MHQYLRAIGFSNPPRRIDIFNLIKDGINKAPTYRAYTTNVEEEDSLLAQYDIALGDEIGISVCGQFDEGDEFYPEYYYPYVNASGVSTDEAIEVERRMDNNSFSGIVEDYRVGVSLVYRVRNSIEYIKTSHTSYEPLAGATTSLSALSIEGYVLLPLYKTSEERASKAQAEQRRLDLIKRAHDGDEDAFQRLQIAEVDTYSNILTGLQTDDIYTIVESFLMPAGSETELYMILGEILRVQTVENRLTGTRVWILTISTNGLELDVAISRKDLVGEPAVGRRFKGRIWLQGRINYQGAW